MATSLPPVSAKVIADIEQFVSEFKRAENVTKRTTSTIDRELSDLSKKTAKKFTIGDMGKDVLRGAGLFGGYQIAQTIADQVVGYYSGQAKFATELETSMARQAELTEQRIALNQTEAQQLAALRVERDRALKDVQGAKKEKQTDEQVLKVNKLTEAYSQLALEVGKAEKAEKKELDTLTNKLNEAYSKALEKEGRGLQFKGSTAELVKKRSEIMDYIADFGTPKTKEQAMDLTALAETALKISEQLEPALRHNAELATRFGDAFGMAMEDAILSGEKLSDVLKNLAQDILRLFVRESISGPIASYASSAFSSMFGVGARASGGPVTGGQPYVVGEQGPELFVPGSSGGIVPNSKMGGIGGPSFNFTYNFQTGVTRQEVAGLLPQMVEASKRAVVDAVNRGGGYRKAFA